MSLSDTTDNDSAIEQAAPASVETTALPDQTDASATSQPDTAEPGRQEAEREKRERSATQRRISSLIGKNAQERTLREQAEKRLVELEARLNSTQAQPRGTPSDGAPRMEDYDDWTKYQADVSRYHALEAIKESQSATRKADQERQTTEANQRKLEAVAKRISDEAKDIPDYMDAVADLPPNDPVFGNALMDSDEPVAVSYYLAHHPDALELVLSKTTPSAMAMAIARLESTAKEFVQSRSRSKAAPQTKPLRPSSGSVPGTLRDNSGMDEHIASYRKYRERRGY